MCEHFSLRSWPSSCHVLLCASAPHDVQRIPDVPCPKDTESMAVDTFFHPVFPSILQRAQRSNGIRGDIAQCVVRPRPTSLCEPTSFSGSTYRTRLLSFRPWRHIAQSQRSESQTRSLRLLHLSLVSPPCLESSPKRFTRPNTWTATR